MSARDDYPSHPLTADSNEYRTVWMDIDDYVAALAEIDRLRHWKAEAMDVLSDWEQVWEVAGCPGALGSSKAESVRVLLSVSPASGPGGDRPTPTGQVTPNHNGDAA